jgi:hypothetical protein
VRAGRGRAAESLRGQFDDVSRGINFAPEAAARIAPPTP